VVVAGRDALEGLCQERRHEVAGHELAATVDEEAPVRVAVPRDADVSLFGEDGGRDVSAVLLDERIGFVIGKASVKLEAEARRPARKDDRKD